MNEIITAIITYVQGLDFRNIFDSFKSQASLIMTDGLAIYLITRKIRGYGYRLRTFIIIAVLVAINIFLLMQRS